ncbi:helix-turn-helix domain-containing protein, partial [Micromonospora sp. DR5-3]|uniref:helix-turn-helix domain-containing protein n=1 Tax=unclassified Micromonospora TaxID=2617518 RepID=UPI0011D5263E
MSAEALSWALSDAPDVPPSCLAVLISLTNHAHANRRAAFSSQERLAFYARKSVRTVRNDLSALARLGLIRRGDQRHASLLPADRRPVVWDLAMERRRPLPAALEPLAEPQSGRPTEAPGPVENRAEAGFPPVRGQAEVQYQTAGSVLPNGRKRASAEPSLTVNNQESPRSLRAAALTPQPAAAQDVTAEDVAAEIGVRRERPGPEFPDADESRVRCR